MLTLHQDSTAFKLDIKCCDNEPFVLARNILLISLLLDDNAKVDSEVLWDFYFKFLIQHNPLHALRNQASKLSEYAASLQDWRSSPYGQHIRFCDEKTLQHVRAVWKAYSPEKLSEGANERWLANMQNATDRAQTEKTLLRDGIIFGHLQLVAPFAVDSAREPESSPGNTGQLVCRAGLSNPAVLFRMLRRHIATGLMERWLLPVSPFEIEQS